LRDYPLGESVIKIVPDMYPECTDDNSLAAETCGDESYLFVHGHQFDKDFAGPLKIYRTYPLMRTVSNSLTSYIPFLFVVSVAATGLTWILSSSFPWEGFYMCLLLFGLSVPFIGTYGARPLWNMMSGMRYRKEETLKRFIRWWDNTAADHSLPENVNVVYGHTHFLNYIPSPKHVKMAEKKGINLYGTLHKQYRKMIEQKNIKEKDMPALVNISAWITDFSTKKQNIYLKGEKAYTASKKVPTKIKHVVSKNEEPERKDRLDPESVTVATFLHIDEDGFEVFGWNWYSSSQKIFHIPKNAILQRRERGPVTDDEATRAVLEEIGWPEEVITLWKKDPHIQ
jgi:hypothetical protein